MQDKLTAEEMLKYLIGVIKENLTELYESLPPRTNMQFVLGEKTAYVECLEVIRFWENARENGLSGNIEDTYPI